MEDKPKTLTAIRHVAFEDLDALAAPLTEAGFTITYLEAGVADLAAFDPLEPDLVVVLGGPLGVADIPDYPVLADELRLLRKRLSARRPTLGVCLGSQLMAHALGASVEPGYGREVGWGPVELTAAGAASPLRHFDGLPVFHWHSDAFMLPSGAVSLAYTAVCPHQAFALEQYALGLQFHPEVSAANLERWYIGHIRELHSHGSPTAPELRASAARHAAALAAAGKAMLQDWLAGLA